MRLPQPRLSRQQRDAERTSLDPAPQFETDTLLQLRKIHVEKLLVAIADRALHFIQKTHFSIIRPDFRVCLSDALRPKKNSSEVVDAGETKP
jgi:hypothetical protein